MEQLTGFKEEKEYVKVVYCHPAYLTKMQSTSQELLGCRKHSLESRLQREISITSDMQMTTTLMAKSEELESLLMKVKVESENVGLKLNIKKSKIMTSGPITSWQTRQGNRGNSERLCQGILTKGSNLALPRCRQISYFLSRAHQGQ